MNDDTNFDEDIERARTASAAHPAASGASELTSYRLFETGDSLFSEGSRGSEAYIIKAGEVHVSCERDGAVQTIANLGPGSIVGEMAVISDMPRVATATAKQDTLCVALSRQAVQMMLDSVDLETRTLIGFLIHHAQARLDGEHLDSDELRRNQKILKILLDTPQQMERLDKLEPFFVLLCNSLLERAQHAT
ncbi:cyclic nucleotide-binding domain-containing protein [Pseudomonadota bacterium]